MQQECEKIILPDKSLRAIDGGKLERLLVWAARFHPDGAVHLVCCHDLCLHLVAARKAGVLEALARAEECRAAIIAGVFQFLDGLLKQAMEGGWLSHVAGLSVYPTGL